MKLLQSLAALLLSFEAAGCGGGATTTPVGTTSSPPPAASRRISLHLAGDSTMGEGLPERRPETGWGEELQPLFDENRLWVRNYSKRGRSTRTFLSEGHWAALLSNVEEGDWVIVQFGHNDGSRDEEETPPAEYEANLSRFVSDVGSRRAHPVLATPIVVRRFDAEGSLEDTHGQYPGLVRAVASATHSPLLDMQLLSAQVVSAYGVEASRELFQHLAPGQHPNYPNGLADNIHLSPKGAMVVAQSAAQGLRDLELPLAGFLK